MPGAPSFEPDRAGGSPIVVTKPSRHSDEWRRILAGAPRAAAVEALGLKRGDSALFVGAHPDDETFGAGATIAALTGAGVEVSVVSLTSGEAALDHLERRDPGLGARRRDEFAAACSALGAARADVLGHPDGGLSARAAAIAESLDVVVAGGRTPDRVLTVWWDDPHPDHRAAGRAAAVLATRLGVPISGFPIWAHHWSDPATVRLGDLMLISPVDPDARSARGRASAAYASQTGSLARDLAPVLPAWFLEWDLEWVVSA